MGTNLYAKVITQLNSMTDSRIHNQDDLINAAVEKAHEHLSKYRQGKQDLIARMATDWPEWSCGLDFYTSFIHPLLRNSFVLNFINYSDRIDLNNMKIRFFYGGKNDNKIELKEFEEFIHDNGDKIQTELTDYAICSVPEVEKKLKFNQKNKEVKLVSVRDADIGVHAFFSLFEGIIRNSAKHREKNRDKNDFIIKIIFWENLDDFYDLFRKNDGKPKDVNLFSGVSISVNVDYYRDKDGKTRTITDNENGGAIELVLPQFLNKKMNQEIIDKTSGRLNPGHWGLKEIKSCAAFISGKKIQAVNTKRVNDYLIIDKTAKFWEDQQERLYYNIKLEKARYILVVLPSDKKPNDEIVLDWQSFGINLVDVTQIKSEDILTDYNFFVAINDISKEEKTDLTNLISEGMIKLPQRKIVNYKTKIDFNKPTVESAFSFIYCVYDEWLKQINAYSNPTNLIIYYDNDDKSTEWQNININNNTTLQFPSGSTWDDSLCSIEKNKNNFVISRHKSFKDIEVFNIDKSKNISYFQEVSYSDLFFSFLMSIDAKHYFSKIVLRQIVESCYLKILVIDERIAQTLENETDKLEKLNYMRIDVAYSVIIGGKEFSFAKSDNSKMINISFDNGQLFQYDIVLIHATRLNEIYSVVSEQYNTKEKFIENLKSKDTKFISFIVHSGRGKTEGDIPSNTPFLEYSIVQKYLIQEPSKFYLTQIALSVQ